MRLSDFKAWSELIRALSMDARHHEVLSHFVNDVRYLFGFKPDHLVLQAVLKSCAFLSALNLGRSLHSYVVKLGHFSCLSISKGLLNVYARANEFKDCEKLFNQMPKYDVVVWNIFLAGLSGSRVHDAEVMRSFHEMHTRSEPKPSPVTIAIVLPVYARLRDLIGGRTVHSFVIKSGMESETLVGNALISMYAKCGSVRDGAHISFSEIKRRDVISWNAMIAGFAENGLDYDALVLFKSMLKGHVEPNYATIASILAVCATLDKYVAEHLGRQLHAYVTQRSEFHGNIFIINALMSFYLRIGRMEEAEALFRRMTLKDIVSWNAFIAGCALNSKWFKALCLFQEMLTNHMVPDSVTLISILPTCGNLHDLRVGREIHGYVLRHGGLCDNTALSNALMSFYSKCDAVDSALKTFMITSQRDLISWNIMVDAYAERGGDSEVLDLLHWMLIEELKPDSITMLTLVQFYGRASILNKVKEAHGYLLRSGLFRSDDKPNLGSAMLNAYAQCGNIDYAHKIFEVLLGKIDVLTCSSSKSRHLAQDLHFGPCRISEGISETDLTTWNIMIRAYAENGFVDDAINVLHELQIQGQKPDAASLMSIIPVCTKTASVNLLKQCHAYMVRAFIEDIQLVGTLIDIYSKCGCINSAYNLFHSSPCKDLVMFTAMIGGYAMNGMGSEALGLFSYMLEFGLKPDHVVLTAVLSACSHAGLMDDGLRIFRSIESFHGMRPTMEQYACIVDLLARVGRVREAYSFAVEIPGEANAKIWSSLLGACKTYNDVELGQTVASHLVNTDTSDMGNYVTMSNLYAADAKWDNVTDMRRRMRTRDFKKSAGCSWLEVGGVNADSSHVESSSICTILHTLDRQVAGSSVL